MCSAPHVSSSCHSHVFQISQGWRSITQHHSVSMFAQSEVILLSLTFTWTVNIMAWPPGPEILPDSGTSNKVLIASWFFLIKIPLFSNMVKTGTMLQEVCAVWIGRALLEPRGRNKHSLKSCKSCCRHTKRAGAKIEIAVWQMIMMILIFPADNCAFFHFLANCLSSGPVLVGFPLGLVWALRFLLNLTFVSKKMVDMQNVERRAPHAWVLLAVWEMRYEECLLGYNR